MKSLSSVLFALVLTSVASVAAASDPVTIPERLQGAERVVVATVASVTATFEQNAYGDQIIVSHLTLSVEETLKGAPAALLTVDVEGGTVGGVSLEVASLPRMKTGERAVFFLEKDGTAYVPHLRGQGILKLNAQDVVKGSSLTLDAIRTMASAQ